MTRDEMTIGEAEAWEAGADAVKLKALEMARSIRLQAHGEATALANAHTLELLIEAASRLRPPTRWTDRG